MRLNSISEIAAFKLAEFFAVVVSATALFWSFPELAYESDKYRSLKSNFFGSFFVVSIFYFFLLFGPISSYLIYKIGGSLDFLVTTPLVNAIFFLIYACLVSYLFSQKSIKIEVIVSISLLSIVVFIFGLGYLALRRRLIAD